MRYKRRIVLHYFDLNEDDLEHLLKFLGFRNLDVNIENLRNSSAIHLYFNMQFEPINKKIIESSAISLEQDHIITLDQIKECVMLQNLGFTKRDAFKTALGITLDFIHYLNTGRVLSLPSA